MKELGCGFLGGLLGGELLLLVSCIFILDFAVIDVEIVQFGIFKIFYLLFRTTFVMLKLCIFFTL